MFFRVKLAEEALKPLKLAGLFLSTLGRRLIVAEPTCVVGSQRPRAINHTAMEMA